MSAALIDGVALAESIKQEVRASVAKMAQPVHLTAVLVGGSHAAELYAQRQAEACAAVGIDYQLLTLPADITQHDLKEEIRLLNVDPAVTGIMMHLPLPAHLNAPRMQYEIDVVKDVEGVNPANIGYVVYGHTLIAPCTALAVIELIKSTGIESARRRGGRRRRHRDRRQADLRCCWPSRWRRSRSATSRRRT